MKHTLPLWPVPWLAVHWLALWLEKTNLNFERKRIRAPEWDCTRDERQEKRLKYITNRRLTGCSDQLGLYISIHIERVDSNAATRDDLNEVCAILTKLALDHSLLPDTAATEAFFRFVRSSRIPRGCAGKIFKWKKIFFFYRINK